MSEAETEHRLMVDFDLTGYENVVGTCSHCNRVVVLNRATDLEGAYPAVRRVVSCPACSESLRLGGDNANHPVDQFRYDANQSFVERRYMQCVITLAQSMELALVLCADAWVLGPFHEDTGRPDFEECAARLSKALDRLTLEQLRRVLVSFALRPRPANLADATLLVSEVGKMQQKMPEPERVAQIGDPALRSLVTALASSSFVQLRNDVVHHAYRPTESEADACRRDVQFLNRHAMTVFRVMPGGGQLVVAPTS